MEKNHKKSGAKLQSLLDTKNNFPIAFCCLLWHANFQIYRDNDDNEDDDDKDENYDGNNNQQ